MTWQTLKLLCTKHCVFGSEGMMCFKCAEENGWNVTTIGSVSSLPAQMPLTTSSIPAATMGTADRA